MNHTVDFYFDYGSPTAYLAYKRLRQLSDSYDLQVNAIPMLLGGVFKATNNTSPVAIPAKGNYMSQHDLPRFAARYGVILNFNPFFPINTLTLMRAAVAAQQLGCFDAYTEAVYEAVWVERKNMGEEDVVIDVLTHAGLDAGAIIDLARQTATKQALIANTEKAVERGVFGAPTMFVGKDMYFGQDRLDFIEEGLGN